MEEIARHGPLRHGPALAVERLGYRDITSDGAEDTGKGHLGTDGGGSLCSGDDEGRLFRLFDRLTSMLQISGIVREYKRKRRLIIRRVRGIKILILNDL